MPWPGCHTNNLFTAVYTPHIDIAYREVNEDIILVVDWSTRGIVQGRVISVDHRDRVPTHISAVHLELQRHRGWQTDVRVGEVGTRTDHRLAIRQGCARLNKLEHITRIEAVWWKTTRSIRPMGI